MDRIYMCIDQKSFYASVECVERGLDPMTALLVVADAERSKNTICLAVSVAAKKRGVKNRCRLGEVPPNLGAIIAPPRMQLYIDYTAEIYGVFLRYFAPEDIYVYSIDESFIDVTPYLAPDVHQSQVNELKRQLRSMKEQQQSQFESVILDMLEQVRKLKSLTGFLYIRLLTM